MGSAPEAGIERDRTTIVHSHLQDAPPGAEPGTPAGQRGKQPGGHPGTPAGRGDRKPGDVQKTTNHRATHHADHPAVLVPSGTEADQGTATEYPKLCRSRRSGTHRQRPPVVRNPVRHHHPARHRTGEPGKRPGQHHGLSPTGMVRVDRPSGRHQRRLDRRADDNVRGGRNAVRSRERAHERQRRGHRHAGIAECQRRVGPAGEAARRPQPPFAQWLVDQCRPRVGAGTFQPVDVLHRHILAAGRPGSRVNCGTRADFAGLAGDTVAGHVTWRVRGDTGPRTRRTQ